MLRYAGGVIAGFLAILVLSAALFVSSFGIFDSHGDRTLASWYQIKRKIAADLPAKPKIVLVGGSNVLYGIASPAIEKRFGVACLNFGTHGGLPLEYILAAAKRVLNPGDLVVLSLEWEYLNRPSDDLNAVFTGYLLGSDPKYFWRLDSTQQWKAFLSAPARRLFLPLFTTREASNGLQNVYLEATEGSHMDEFGDYKGNTPASRNKVELARLQKIPLNPCPPEMAAGDTPFWKTLKSFLAWARAKRVTVVYAAPALLDHSELSSAENRRVFAAAEAHYSKIGLPVVSNQSANYYGEELMYDTIYHLNSAGRELRTAKLIEGLAPVARRVFGSPAP